ncbi:NAD(P)H-hydrate epimerase [Georgenia sp. EYE_87]|uniref:NAD(P)H-hydrate epimerase n=1 Tax=Georgenia sp. EYE_87 TaxID=2853448 RepID=UPI002002DAA3|nr:NAD(P)H-hydrate epimerase [Georgenia sp. EYE_87]MCK6209919.1 NAD(P)H-hydrate epimerase [Georgenia sp. EYE_87]
MIRAHHAAAVRAAEEPLLAAGEPLMASAAFALATHVVAELRARGRVAGSVVLLVVGGGNNGGDALFAGTHLVRRGCQVHAALVSDDVHPEGLAAARAAGVLVHRVLDGADPAADVLALARRCGLWVDAVTGIGARGPLREPAAAVVAALAEERARWPQEPVVVAVDVPSGIGVDDGTVAGPVLPADVTVTMGTAKPGLLLPPASGLAGRVEVVELGLDALAAEPPAACSLTAADVADLWPVPGPDDHKYTRGVLGLAAGSQAYPGAAALAAAGALRTGLGMVRYLGPEVPSALVRTRHPEVVTVPGRVQAWVLGPGVGPDDAARTHELYEHLLAALAAHQPVVLDAGALTLLHEEDHLPDLPATAVLTPHAGELAALLTARGEETGREAVTAAPARHARLAAELTGATVLLKGPTTVVAAPDGPLYAQHDATPWLATAGAGDVLAGVLGALLAAYGDLLAGGLPEGVGVPASLAAAAALVHGRAARIAAGLPPEAARAGAPVRAGVPGWTGAPGRTGAPVLTGVPIAAGDVAAALPAALRTVLA